MAGNEKQNGGRGGEGNLVLVEGGVVAVEMGAGLE